MFRLALRTSRPEFLSGFHDYIANRTSHKTNTVWIYLVALKHVLSLAFDRGLIDRNLFPNYKPHSEFCPRDCLTMDESMRIAELEPDHPGLGPVRDAYLFSCFTGLSYADIKSLTMCNVKKRDGQLWIYTTRRKTGTAVQVRLFELPGALLTKRMPDSQTAPIFPLPSNGWCNACLKKNHPPIEYRPSSHVPHRPPHLRHDRNARAGHADRNRQQTSRP